MNAKEKNRLAGILLMANGGLMTVIYLMMWTFFGIVFNNDPNNMPGMVFTVATVVAAVSFATFILPQIIAGWKMYKEEPNAKNWGVAGAILACISSFLGIGVGVFALITLFSNDGKRFYDSLSGRNYLNPANPIDDLSYQNYQQQQPREPHTWR